MKKSIGVTLCICLLTGLVSGCGSKKNNLTEDSNTAVFERSGKTKTIASAESDNEQQQVDWTIETVEESSDLEQGELLWKDLDQKTLTIVYYTDVDGNEFYITDKEALQKCTMLLGGLRGVQFRRDKLDTDGYIEISFKTTDERSRESCIIYRGNYLYRYSNGCYKMQDDFEEVVSDLIADLTYFTSTDYLLSLVETKEEQQIIQGILKEEDSRLVRLVVNRIEDLNYCLFETSKGQGLEFHLLLWGSWEGKEIRQHQILFLNDEERDSLEQLSEWCEVRKEDMDFDGRPDLLIYEGYSQDAKNSFDHYRVMRWDEAQGQFTYYPSFPFWTTWMNLEDKQVFDKVKGPASDRIVKVYEVVDGEYRVVQELDLITDFVPMEYEGGIYEHAQEILSYYKNGDLVWEYDVTEMDWDEMEELCREADVEGLSEIFSHTRDYG